MKSMKRTEIVFSLIANVLLMFIVNNLLNWNLAFVLPKFKNVIWAANLAFGVAILGYLFLLIADGSRKEAVTKITINLFWLNFSYVLYLVFPFDFAAIGIDWLNPLLKFLIVFSIIAMIIAILIEISKITGKK